MSNETLEIIKKYISDTLGVKMVEASTELDEEAFNIKLGGTITCIHISRPFINFVEKSDDIKNTLEDLNILSVIKANPLCNISLRTDGIKVEPINQ